MADERGREMKLWEKLAQKALSEPDPKKALELFEQAKVEAIKAGDMKGGDNE